MTENTDTLRAIKTEGHGTVELPDDWADLSDEELVALIDDLAALQATSQRARGQRYIFQLNQIQFEIMAELARRTLDVEPDAD